MSGRNRFSILGLLFCCTLLALPPAPGLANVKMTRPAAPTAAASSACPFCSAIALTFSEQLNNNEVAVIAKLVEPPPPPSPDADEFPKGKFEIVGVLKGQKVVQNGMTFMTQLVGSYPEGQKFLVMGVNPPKIAWTTPMRASDRVFQYLKDIQELPAKGPDRLVFFQDYFEDKEPVLAFDAYDEFAKAPYEDLIAMKDRMQRDKLVGWIKDPETTVNRRRLYLTMLGVCGKEQDIKMLEGFIKSGDRKQQAGLDALVACYLTLKGADGVKLIEDSFLKDPDVDYVDTHAAISALRFHATESDIVPQQRIVEAVRLLLDRPQMADMIIPDLARWKDWSVMDRLVKMFKEADGETSWLRVPVITYLRACPKPEAAKYIEELRKIDPQAVERADFFIGFGDEEEDDWNDDEEEDDDWDDAQDKAKPAEAAKPDKSKGGAGQGGESNKTDAKQGGKSNNDGLSINQPIAIPNQPVQIARGPEVSFRSPRPDGQDLDEQSSPVSVPVTPENETTFVSMVDSSQSMDESVPAPSARRDVENASLTESQENERQQLAQVGAPTVVATASPGSDLTLTILLVPFGGSLLLLALMWSVFNGWFERLIY